mmetsp:Transcript_8300/g.12288  ORF Transcript_8300/g.12288 Transcript_8300/m.12288 type:complete len:563 (-) Transcript_8300:290-1978(-)
MWMEPVKRNPKPGAESKSKFLRMKLRARWYFKKEDMAGIGGTYVGVKSRKALLETLGPRDLILGDQFDDNEVPTILGTCNVIRCAPSEKSEEVPKGSYTCRWDVNIPKRGQAGFGTVRMKPYESTKQTLAPASPIAQGTVEQPKAKSEESEGSVMDLGTDTSQGNSESVKRKTQSSGEEKEEKNSEPPVKRAKAEEEADTAQALPAGKDKDGDETESMDMETENETAPSDSAITPSTASSPVNGRTSTNATEEENNDDSSDDDSDGSSEVGVSTTEGKIRVGAAHQVVVPPVASIKDSAAGPFQLNVLCKPSWLPGNISKDALDSYLKEANSILVSIMETEPEVSLMQSSGADESLVLRTSFKVLREGDEDALLDELHISGYKKETALMNVKKNPKAFLNLWINEEKSQFDQGFKRYCGSLRMIAKGVPTKTTKDIVDYHYRFKIPDQFTKFQEKRKEQAQRMAAMADAKNDDGAKGAKTKAKSGGKLSATEQRRILAREFLVDARDKVGADRYRELSQLLKQFHDKVISVPQLKQHVSTVLGKDSDLLSRFGVFLPRKFRG